MMDFRKRRLTFLLVGVLLLCISMSILAYRESKICLGVQILPVQQAKDYTSYQYFDYSGQLTFSGEPVAIDLESSTIYISESIKKNTQPQELAGKLRISDNSRTLYFLPDAQFDSLYDAMTAGHAFQMIVSDGSPQYMQYNVVFTSLPVLCMEGKLSHIRKEDGIGEMAGSLCLWTPNDPDTGGYSVKTSDLWYHLRGNSSLTQDKKSQKLSLKNGDGENQNMAFLGLGSDDDWILNPMNMDDTKMREKLFMDLWNQMTEISGYNFKMSTGDYVEVVINGEYQGVFLLQRRLDDKYLELSPEDILLKVTDYQAKTPREAYEIIYSNYPDWYVYEQMDGIFYKTDYSNIDVKNLVDTNLFLQTFAALDNLSMKNMYIVLIPNGTEFVSYFIPWDTDMSLGLTWQVGVGFAVDYEGRIQGTNCVRNETRACAKIYPQLDVDTSQRWFELRKTFLSEDHLISLILDNQSRLASSGAYSRDQEIWGEKYSGEDTVDALKQFVAEHLAVLDSHYALQ